MVDQSGNADIVMAMLRSIEDGDRDRLFALYHPAIIFHWPPDLPYGGTLHGAAVEEMTALFCAVWEPLQPTRGLRRMDPRIVATGGNGHVVARYRWQGEAPGAGHHAAETLAEYVVRDGRVARAQMFHFDLIGLLAFLDRVGATWTAANGRDTRIREDREDAPSHLPQ